MPHCERGGLAGRIVLHTPDPALAVSLLNGRVEHREHDRLLVRGDDPAALNALLVARGVRVTELRVQRRTLEDSVLELTGPSTDRKERVQ